MTINRITTITFCLLFAIGYSQNRKIRKADNAYNEFSYVKTSDILLDVANKGFKSVDLLKQLGNSFYFNNKMAEAVKWYGELINLNEFKADEHFDTEYYFRYAQALKSIENYEESDKWMQKFYNANSSDLRGKSYQQHKDYLTQIEGLSQDFQIFNLEINTKYSDFGGILYNDQVIFSSARGKGRTYAWNNQPFLNLYMAKSQDGGTSFDEPIKWDKTINSKFHESSLTFYKNDEFMFFTRNNFIDHIENRSKDGINKLKIFQASFENNEWGNIKSVHFNSDEYNVAHPSVNASGTKMYFASDMPGTYGKSDIYMVAINKDGSLGVPENLGPYINTEGHETFPFINAKGDLFFASNGIVGLGGLDVFVIRDFETKMDQKVAFEPKNLGMPINSSKDDFAYYENLETRKGFFSSNRAGGKGDDDIYGFTIPRCTQTVVGSIWDKNSNNLLTNVIVTLLDSTGNTINQAVVDDESQFMFNELDCEKAYLIRAEKEGYATFEKRFETASQKETLSADLILEKENIEISVGSDLAKTLNIPIIYFNTDDDNITGESEIQLQKLLAVLNSYPNMVIEVNSHTDSRGTREYNDNLSNRRVVSTIKYLTQVGGISASRIKGKGYGERKLVNDCGDNSKCSDEEHLQNRRSEFIIISMN
ncbi:OmpA family protein [Geojedonia litorea]|uniref:OmpA family protein n=1 Tax=Geojedonia litorea TaxID=1268269 RepID=A0ABV9MZU9_9FLAO